MKPRVVVVTVPDMISDADLKPLREVADVAYEEREKVSESELAAICEGYEYLMLNYDVIKKIGPDFWKELQVNSLKAVATDITGMDWSSPAGAKLAGVTLLNIPHYSTESVAESILCEVLLHTRQRHSAYMDELRGREVQAREGINLSDRTCGIVGLGSIGTRTAKLLESVGMHVIAWNRTPRDAYPLVTLEELFTESAVVCVCLATVLEGPDANRGIITADLLARCRGTVVVNLANYNLVDHDAMARAINDGRVTGYTVERTPALLQSDLARLDAVHMPPSNAWASPESMATLRRTWVQNVVSAIDGRPENVFVSN